MTIEFSDIEALFERPPERVLDLGHSGVPYRSIGTGPDVLLIHGWPMSSVTWRFILPSLAQRFTCHLIDLPGAGESRFDRQTPISLVDHAESLKTVVDQLELLTYSVIAHDTGGAIARYLAVRDPRVNALLISGTEIPKNHPFIISFFSRAARLPLFEWLMRRVLRWRFVQRSPLGFGGAYGDLNRINDDFQRYTVEPICRTANAMYGVAELMRTLTKAMIDDLEAVHGELSIPVQLIWGEDDPYFPVQKAQEMVSQFKDARIQVIKGGKLMVHEGFAAEYSAIALPFLAQVARP